MIDDAIVEYKKAIDIYERALQANPRLWGVANNLAFLYTEYSTSKEDFEKALVLSKKVQKVNPGKPEFMDTLGWTHYKLGNFSLASGILERAVEISPDNPIISYHLGVVQYKSGRVFECRANFENAVASEMEFSGKEEARNILEKIK